MTEKRPYILRREAGSGVCLLFVATWLLIILFTSSELSGFNRLVLLILSGFTVFLGLKVMRK